VEGIEMIGDVVMEIQHDEMKAAVQFYLNKDVFDADGSLRVRHKATVTDVRQRSNGNFIIEFHGWYLPKETSNGSDDVS
jgi:hypothetical protein